MKYDRKGHRTYCTTSKEENDHLIKYYKVYHTQFEMMKNCQSQTPRVQTANPSTLKTNYPCSGFSLKVQKTLKKLVKCVFPRFLAAD